MLGLQIELPSKSYFSFFTLCRVAQEKVLTVSTFSWATRHKFFNAVTLDGGAICFTSKGKLPISAAVSTTNMTSSTNDASSQKQIITFICKIKAALLQKWR